MVRLVCLLAWLPASLFSQSLNDLYQAGAGPIPEKILSGRSFVFVSPGFTEKEIQTLHTGFIKTGIDAIGYSEVDKLFAGFDITQAFVKHFQSREVTILIFALKINQVYELIISTFESADGVNGPTLIIPGSVWKTQNKVLDEIMQTLHRTALTGRQKQNLLINEVPETDLPIRVITGNRRELFAYDLKVDVLAVQKFGDEKQDRELEEIMKSYPFKYQLVDPKIPETELRKQGLLYVLRHIHTRGPAAKQLLGYDVSMGEGALVSVTYPNGLEQIKTIPADVEIHKFYVRQIEFEHVFLGPKWDADTTWQQALQNFIKGLRSEMKVN
ncbi:hypothetical protein QQ054_21235 [Oscillatoria amoena NRMC-F 0135]|nr:hypothetical protein [Oscillatoria amoena NRMC-F 0135]